MTRAVFLDRDGVINRAIVKDGKPYPPSCLAELEILPGVADALIQLNQADFLLIVVTNQPDVARGVQSRASVEEMHDWLKARLPLDGFRVCYHDDADRCDCRKPLPGLILAAARDFGIDVSKSFMIGDRWRDVEAGDRAGCQNAFIDYKYSEKRPTQPHACVRSLAEATDWILSTLHTERKL